MRFLPGRAAESLLVAPIKRCIPWAGSSQYRICHSTGTGGQDGNRSHFSLEKHRALRDLRREERGNHVVHAAIRSLYTVIKCQNRREEETRHHITTLAADDKHVRLESAFRGLFIRKPRKPRKRTKTVQSEDSKG